MITFTSASSGKENKLNIKPTEMFKKRKQLLSDEPAHQKPLRLWLGVVIVILQWLVRYGLPVFVPDALAVGVFGGVIGGLAVVIWWAFLSRAPRIERWVAILLMIVALAATSQIIHKSIATTMMGMMFVFYSIPVMSLAFVVWAVASRNLSNRLRRSTMVATILVAAGFWAFLRTDGMDGEAHQDFAWRWAKTAEERLLAKAEDKQITMPSDSETTSSEAEWPGFRGPNRNGIVQGVQIKTDWSKSPPVEMWRRSVGPGCSSFAIHGALLFTQEQRGEYEMVTCYNLKTGESVWKHSDKARFWDSHAGAGPRSTPTLYRGRVYTLGATGILNVLNESDGTVIWSRDAAKDTEVKIPVWGYASSPLVVDSTVIVAIAGELVAYDIVNGKKRWFSPDGEESYSSPHLLRVDGTRQVLFMNNVGTTSYSPSEGKELWKIPGAGSRIVQPAQISNNEILVDPGNMSGIQHIAINNKSGKWNHEDLWTSNKLKLYFSDFVVHKGFVYGYDGPSLTCIDIEKGNRNWKAGRYGGQIILLADQDLLLVLSEKGELALVKATPDKFTELARFPAIKGKTWNHPVMVGDVVVVRNTEEMAAFRLPLADNQ